MNKGLDLKRKLHRLRQQFGWKEMFLTQYAQVRLVQKLYERNGFRLLLTSSACPEQYDVFMGEEQVAYLRLRHGFFTVEYPDVMGELLFEDTPKGDGCFDNIERIPYLVKVLRLIQQKICA